MSEQDTSGESTVASSATNSAPPSPVAPTVSVPAAPAFGSSRGSGLARGKRATSAAPATATKSNDTPSDYRPTAIQVVTTEREYKNPFAAETSRAPAETAAQVAAVISDLPVAPPSPAPEVVKSIPTAASAASVASPVSNESEDKAELKILPPEERQRPSQSWERSSSPETASSETSPRREERGTFRVERRGPSENVPTHEPLPNREPREFRENREQRSPREAREPRQPRDPREARQPRDPRDQRQPRDPRDERQPREAREFRTGTPRPLPTPPAPVKKGIFAWLKNLFAGQPAAPTSAVPETPARDARPNDDQFRRQNNRSGRGRSGGQRGDFRNQDNRGPRENRGPAEGSSENANSERRFDGGQRRRRHRGGRGRGGFDNRGGDSRSDSNGGSNES